MEIAGGDADVHDDEFSPPCSGLMEGNKQAVSLRSPWRFEVVRNARFQRLWASWTVRIIIE